MMCSLFDDKITLNEPLDGMESMASQSAHTRGLIKIDTVRWTSECRWETEENRKGFINMLCFKCPRVQKHLNYRQPELTIVYFVV